MNGVTLQSRPPPSRPPPLPFPLISANPTLTPIQQPNTAVRHFCHKQPPLMFTAKIYHVHLLFFLSLGISWLSTFNTVSRFQCLLISIENKYSRPLRMCLYMGCTYINCLRGYVKRSHSNFHSKSSLIKGQLVRTDIIH